MDNNDQAIQARTILGDQVSDALTDIVRAQIELATGIYVMMAKEWVVDKNGVRKRNGKWNQVTDAYEIKELLNGSQNGEDFYKIYIKDPNPKAASYLFDQLAGRAKESIDINQKNQTLADIIAALDTKK